MRKHLRERKRDESSMDDLDMTTTANLLLQLSCQLSKLKPIISDDTVAAATFKCKQCNHGFRSFQALGGHCTSHKRSARTSHQLFGLPSDHHEIEKPKRMHDCVVCGLKFLTGQALGGHMRRHRPLIEVVRGFPEQKKLLDLNELPN